MAPQAAENATRLLAGALLTRWRSARALQHAGGALAQQQSSWHAGSSEPSHGSAQGFDSFSTSAEHSTRQQDHQPQQHQQQKPQQQHQQQQQEQEQEQEQQLQQQRAWIERVLPASALPYAHLMRLEKPIGTYLLAWPGLWSIALAASPGHLPDPWLSSLFVVGAVLLRGAGCTINDLWDRDIDKQVARTRTRPLASGAVTVPQAIAFLGAQLSLGLVILLQLNTFTQILGASSLLLVATYPLMKRITGWPQAFLGLTFNWGAIMGWAAVHGSCNWAAVLPLYLAGVNWSLVYDTIYAHQDKEDDKKVGIGSTALTLGARTKPALAGFAAAQAACLLAAGAAVDAGSAYHAAVAASAAHQAWQILSTNLDDGPDCMRKFVSNKWYGAIMYGGIVADRLMAG